MGSATVQLQLWGTGPGDWGEVIEPLLRPIRLATAEALAPLSGLRLLDAGSGTELARGDPAGRAGGHRGAGRAGELRDRSVFRPAEGARSSPACYGRPIGGLRAES
jgi:hypothetical protein